MKLLNILFTAVILLATSIGHAAPVCEATCVAINKIGIKKGGYEQIDAYLPLKASSAAELVQKCIDMQGSERKQKNIKKFLVKSIEKEVFDHDSFFYLKNYSLATENNTCISEKDQPLMSGEATRIPAPPTPEQLQ